MREFLLIGGGAVLGANARYWLTNYFASRLGAAFPHGTLIANVTGSFLLGFVLVLIANRLVADPGYRLLIGTGFLGAYTTFSTFSYDTIALLEVGDFLPALWNVLLSVALSLTAAYLGIVLARLVG
ncbi:MAG TPA: fluoride efflux transporter CrcB [Chloroflexia bacterium]|nr:fluoride efflux transporter CrcB [Chloroflexia bacterium]